MEARLLLETERPCPYLSDQLCSNLFVDPRDLKGGMNDQELNFLLERGFRHFGEMVFRPFCPACDACRTLWLDPQLFVPTRSHKRTLNRNQDLSWEFVPGHTTDPAEHVALLNAFQSFRTQTVQWEDRVWTQDEYHQAFTPHQSWSYTLEIRQQGILVAATQISATQQLQNHIYAYYAPELRARAPGVWMVLLGMAWAKSLNRTRVYLGLWNAKCPSLAYKSQFQPHTLE